MAPSLQATSQPVAVKMGRRERYLFLDGLRGWAALAVVNCHCFIEIFPWSRESARFLAYLMPFNGQIAVYLFFVISGFSLSTAYIKRGDRSSLARMAASRYPRLALPIFAACALVSVAMSSGLIPPADLRASPLDLALRFAPTIHHLLQFSFFDVFFRYAVEQAYIIPLWTMRIELFGSVMVFLLLAFFGRKNYRLWVYGALSIGLAAYGTMYCLFPAGVLLAEFHARDLFRSARWKWILTGFFVLGWLTPWLTGHKPSIFYFASMTCFCGAVARVGPIRAFFENRVSRFLGYISFPLYLLHGPILYSLSQWLLVGVRPFGLSSGATNLIVALATVPTAILAAVAFAPANDFAIAVSRRFGASVVNLGQRTLEFRPRRPLRALPTDARQP